MRTPSRRDRRRQLCSTEGVDLDAIAERVGYVGSAEHKAYPSMAGPPRPRADPTKCDPALHGSFGQLTEWLQEGVRKGNIGAPWEGDFPRYIWVVRDSRWYEGRLVNCEQGQYKGYEITVAELPEGV